jgi:hypothetical protein
MIHGHELLQNIRTVLHGLEVAKRGISEVRRDAVAHLSEGLDEGHGAILEMVRREEGGRRKEEGKGRKEGGKREEREKEEGE